MPATEFQRTPNPNAGKFVVGRPVVEPGTSRSCYDPAEAADDPVARALMGIPGVRSIFMVDDFVTVSKTADADWEELAPRVVAVLDSAP